MDTQARKQAAMEFLALASAGHAQEAAKRFLAPGGRHHNPHVAAGWTALAQAMDANARENPHKSLEIQRALAEDDLVAIHSRVTLGPSGPTLTVVHIFRFEGQRIAEMWDIGAPLPTQSPNPDGAF